MSNVATVEVLKLLGVGIDFPEHLLVDLKSIVKEKFSGRPPEETRVNVVCHGVAFEFRVRHEGLDDFILEPVGSHTVSSVVVSLEMEEGT